MSDPETDPMADYERLRGDAGTVFSLPLDRKVAVAVAGLATAASFGPVITAQSAEVRALENGPGAALNIVGGVSILLGVVLMFIGGTALVAQRYYVGQAVAEEERLKWFLRIEDLWMWVLTLGTIITVLCMSLMVPAALSLGSPEAVSDAGFGIYSEFDPLPFVIGAWLVSALAGGALAVVGGSWLWVRYSLRRG